MERRWSLTLKEKWVRRQQILQVLVEFRGSIHAADRNQRRRSLHHGGPPRSYQNCQNSESSHLTACEDPMGAGCQRSNPPGRERAMEGADNQRGKNKAAQQDRVCIRVTAHDSTGVVLAEDSLERKLRKRIRKTKMRPKVSSHLNIGATVTSGTNTDARETLHHKG
ncbi:hypothetical protein MC885_012227 [Smutsia gigantea]|nr:hypothetical protein MC885_012227 [Smutsia gigantea]